jgi:hypothetical protein
MLRALFLLFFVGGALYAGLAVTHSALTGDTGDDSSEYSYVLAIRSPASETVAVPLRSWGANLQSLRNEPQRSVPASQPVADRDNRPASAALAVAASSSEGEEAIGWARVALAARAHGDASVSSPTIHFYRAGAELEIVGRDGAWLKLRDPATKEEGWVFEQYVSLMDRPCATQVVAAAPKDHATPAYTAATEASAHKPKAVKSAKAKKPGRSLKPSATPELAAATLDPRRGQLASRGERRGLGLFLFGRRMAKVEAEGRVATR